MSNRKKLPGRPRGRCRKCRSRAGFSRKVFQDGVVVRVCNACGFTITDPSGGAA